MRATARRYAVLSVAVVALGLLNAACARPTKTIAFQGDSTPPKTGILAQIDMIFTAGTTASGTRYPVEYATPAPFIHFQVAEVGTVLSYSLKVFPIEPGQKVTCIISINGLIVDRSSATFPKPAVCSGPPV